MLACSPDVCVVEEIIIRSTLKVGFKLKTKETV